MEIPFLAPKSSFWPTVPPKRERDEHSLLRRRVATQEDAAPVLISVVSPPLARTRWRSGRSCCAVIVLAFVSVIVILLLTTRRPNIWMWGWSRCADLRYTNTNSTDSAAVATSASAQHAKRYCWLARQCTVAQWASVIN